VTDGRPTWILLPGFSQMPAVWNEIAGRLARSIIPFIPEGCDFTTAARLLAEQHGAGMWAGYSMGGRLALQVAIDHPDLVDHLVLISATAGIRDPEGRNARRRADEKLATEVEQHGVERLLDLWTAHPLFADVDPNLLGAHRMRSGAAIADQLRRLGQGAQPPLWDRLGSLAVPTTVVAGACDEKYATIAVELAAAIPDARLVIVPGAGHALLIERPDVIGELLCSLA
jgi:2-succinyl-6-hydroxy-2,4-cyclohexadiene-1-carboxylate synthase